MHALFGTQSKDNGKKTSRYLFLVVAIVCLSLGLVACDNSKLNSNSTKELPNQTALPNKAKNVAFAPTVERSRKGTWFGGKPPLNKRQSGIDTYYRITAGATPNHVKMTLRFEGVKSDDAKVSFRAIDGAQFENPEQQQQWYLKPSFASEITVDLVVPDNISYLTLDTFQNGMSSSRAFSLAIPKKR